MVYLPQRFLKNESGNTALEYAVLAATVSVALIAGMNGLGLNIAVTLAKAGLLSLGLVSQP